jgi:hypothetical protein
VGTKTIKKISNKTLKKERTMTSNKGANFLDGQDKNQVKWAGYTSIIQGLILFIPLIVLGAAINWPATLGDPASIALPRLLENESAVRTGYVFYLIYSILFLITISFFTEIVLGKNNKLLVKLIIGFAIASVLARCIGIIRWLAPMYDLANLWKITEDQDQKNSISVVFEALNSYGGTIGEVLGVSIFASLSILFLVVGNYKSNSLPRWFSIFGLVAVIGLILSSLGIIGIDPGEFVITMGTTILQLWFLFTGIWLLRQSRKLKKA